jgi:hypothetical protein
LEIVFTEETTSIGTLMAELPVAGSVTLALFTRAPLWVLRAPFGLIRPSGPRTTPGTRGNTLSNRSFTLGASAIVFSVIVFVIVGDLLSSAVSVTVTDVVTVIGFSSNSALTTVPASTLTSWVA